MQPRFQCIKVTFQLWAIFWQKVKWFITLNFIWIGSYIFLICLKSLTSLLSMVWVLLKQVQWKRLFGIMSTLWQGTTSVFFLPIYISKIFNRHLSLCNFWIGKLLWVKLEDRSGRDLENYKKWSFRDLERETLLRSV